MKIVLTTWNNRISPVADSARQLLVVDVENQIVRERHEEPLDTDSVFNRARRIYDLGVKIFICGAISDFFSNLLEGYGITLITSICGPTEDVLRAYIDDTLPCPEFNLDWQSGSSLNPRSNL